MDTKIKISQGVEQWAVNDRKASNSLILVSLLIVHEIQISVNGFLANETT